MPEERELICIVCPTGCTIKVHPFASDKRDITLSDITGNRCKRGADYALAECTNPTRTLTTTVRVIDGKPGFAPVKSEKPLPKGKLFDCMRLINNCVLNAPVVIGDVVIENILDTGVNIVTTSNIQRRKADA